MQGERDKYSSSNTERVREIERQTRRERGRDAAICTAYQVMVGEVHSGNVRISTHARAKQPRVGVKKPPAPQDVDEQEVSVDLQIEHQQGSVVVQRPQPVTVGDIRRRQAPWTKTALSLATVDYSSWVLVSSFSISPRKIKTQNTPVELNGGKAGHVESQNRASACPSTHSDFFFVFQQCVPTCRA